ncbi:MAG: alpha-glucan family phosphorylase [Nanoarchaeota archaeon]|nr:alpha-glucan family phosphorylase [Nanoarchaeota archaeon]
MKFNPKDFDPRIAYMSMGAYLESYLPTYSGGLEILSGDILRSCADHRVPIVGIIQASNSGYYRQMINGDGSQRENDVYWEPKSSLTRIDETISIEHEGRKLTVGAEVFVIEGVTGYKVPVFLLDTDFDCNSIEDRGITGMLYGNQQRIAQENVLGQAGVKLMKKLGYDIEKFHMNEGHAAFGALELLAEGYSTNEVRDNCVFTTHTPVVAGHDQWDYGAAGHVVGKLLPENIRELAGKNNLNMTQLALNLSGYVNAVSKKHAEVCISMGLFNGRKIDYITNGVHPSTWVGHNMHELFNRHFNEWRLDSRSLEGALDHIPIGHVLGAKDKAKRRMIGWLNAENDVKLSQDPLTIVWARRFAPYKRPDLILRDVDKLHQLAEKYGKLQILFAGKPHPEDWEGKGLLQQVVQTSKELANDVRCAFIEGYDTKIAKRLLAGADVWLNTPRRPEEASGTSGMKALFNGTLNLSVFDGWVPEGVEIDPKALFLIGPQSDQVAVNSDRGQEDEVDAQGLYDGLEEIMDLFNNKKALGERMLHSISLAPRFSTDRVVKEYADKAWSVKLY